MPADYDLVIIGQNPTAAWTAWHGVQQYARIALVTQTLSGGSDAENLSHAGVDYVVGCGQFKQDSSRTSIFEVNHRQLRASRYLLSLEATPKALDIPGLESGVVQDLRQGESLIAFPDPSRESLPHHILLVGSGPLTVELSQILRGQGFEISLISPRSLLSHEEPSAVFFLQCQLEAQGIQVYSSDTLPPGTLNAEGKLELMTRQGQVIGDGVVTPDHSSVSLSTLNLKALGIHCQDGRITVDECLQTRHPMVYACGDSLGGYRLRSLAQAEAAIALHNTLNQSAKAIAYHHLPYVLPGAVPLGRIGYTVPQARQRFSDIVEFELTLPASRHLRLTHSEGSISDCSQKGMFSLSPFHGPLFCKGVAQADGMLVGVHLVGDAAPLVLESVAIAVQNQMHVVDLPQLRPAHELIQQLFERLANRWQRSRNPKYRDCQEKAFRKVRKRHPFSR